MSGSADRERAHRPCADGNSSRNAFAQRAGADPGCVREPARSYVIRRGRRLMRWGRASSSGRLAAAIGWSGPLAAWRRKAAWRAAASVAIRQPIRFQRHGRARLGGGALWRRRRASAKGARTPGCRRLSASRGRSIPPRRSPRPPRTAPTPMRSCIRFPLIRRRSRARSRAR